MQQHLIIIYSICPTHSSKSVGGSRVQVTLHTKSRQIDSSDWVDAELLIKIVATAGSRMLP